MDRSRNDVRGVAIMSADEHSRPDVDISADAFLLATEMKAGHYLVHVEVGRQGVLDYDWWQIFHLAMRKQKAIPICLSLGTHP